MTSLRRWLPRWAAAWLVFQVASVATLLATDCCVTHQAVSTDRHGCHNTAPAPHCPMRGADGSSCPMHRGGVDAAATTGSCSLRGTCSEPMTALAALLANQGVLTAPLHLMPNHGVTIVHSRMQDEPLVSRPDAPAPPPPRA